MASGFGDSQIEKKRSAQPSSKAVGFRPEQEAKATSKFGALDGGGLGDQPNFANQYNMNPDQNNLNNAGMDQF